MADQLKVESRKSFGKRNNERLRRSGRTPATLYGHGEEPLSLSVAADQLGASLRHGAKVVDLDGAATGKALLQDIQWDTFYQHVLHVDFLRVLAGEKVTVEVPIELKGEAPGVSEGGIIEHVLHSIEIECPLDVIPEKLHVSIKNLKIGDHLTAKDITLPAGATLLTDEDEMVVHCIAPMTDEEAEAGEEGAAEPEVISKGKADEEEAEEKE